MMSSNAMNVSPNPEPGVRNAREVSVERERATLAFLAEYSAAVALRRRQRGIRTVQRMTNATTPEQPGWGDPKRND